MPVSMLSISHAEAVTIVAAIIEKAETDGGSPVAVAVVDHAGRLLAFTAMDNVMPASITLAQSKAYSAVVGKRDTIQWASTKKNSDCIDFDMRNWTDEHFTGFTGGIIFSFNQQVIGGIAVSGRKGRRDEADILMQDNELAEYGRSVLTI
ncbi:MAG: heme-binding protein [Ferruginibacter sp.]|nr:heme-binding protein [Ferruginibacter sp.]